MAEDDVPRVSILKTPALPLDVAAALFRRVRWLRLDLETIDAELGLRFPPVEVVPVCCMRTLRDGTRRNVVGRVRLRPCGGVDRFTVQLPAPVLLEYPDDLIRGILAHEFLHVVYWTLEVARFAEANPGGTFRFGQKADPRTDGVSTAESTPPTRWTRARG